jgi:hypothetical protein
MADWKYKLNIRDDWQRAKESEIHFSELAGIIAKKLRAFKIPEHEDLELWEVIDRFEEIAQHPEEHEVADFDWVMRDLYDWADTEVPPLGKWPPNRKCWVGVL